MERHSILFYMMTWSLDKYVLVEYNESSEISLVYLLEITIIVFFFNSCGNFLSFIDRIKKHAAGY